MNRDDLQGKSSFELERLGHRYLVVTYVTIKGAGGQIRIWSFELVSWLAANPGTMIVELRD